MEKSPGLKSVRLPLKLEQYLPGAPSRMLGFICAILQIDVQSLFRMQERQVFPKRPTIRAENSCRRVVSSLLAF